MMKPNRVKWKVHLERSNLKAIEGKMVPRVHLYGSLSMDQVIDRIVRDGANTLARETMVHAVSAFFREVEELIVAGYAVRTPIGNFTPGVTGTWNFDRLLPDARAQNEATVNYALSPQLKKRLADPLFEEIGQLQSRLAISVVEDKGSGTKNTYLTPGYVLIIKGELLLMNGDLPERGLYFLDAETEQTVRHVAAEDIYGTRKQCWAHIPRDLPPGRYLLRIVSQCTTSPTPLKRAASYTYKVVFEVRDLEGTE